MRVRFKSSGRVITFDRSMRLGGGGEGAVYSIPGQPSLAAKVYHPSKATHERGRKLAVMLSNPPDDAMRASGHDSIAWPEELLELPGTGKVVGFVMARVDAGMRPVVDFYDPKARLLSHPAFTYHHLMRAARNLASAVGALHAKGYIIGDVNESNVMVDRSTALVTLVDTDSFQVIEPGTGRNFRCHVGKEDFTPPELQGKDFGAVTRLPQHDMFGVAVLIFQLLMEGTPPFAGVFKGAGDPPQYGSRIALGHFPYCRTRKSLITPGPLAPPFDLLAPRLRQLFLRCFEDGHASGTARPDAEEWRQALKESEAELTSCAVNGQHYFGKHLSACPWCERARVLPDPFPSRAQTSAVQQSLRRRRRNTAAPRRAVLPRRAVPQPQAAPPPVIHSFRTAAGTITAGQSCVLSWHVSNVQTVSISGVGVVGPTGSVSVNPQRSSTYTLRASGAGGAVNSSVQVTVRPYTPIQAFSASASSVVIGRPVALRWRVDPAYVVSLNRGIGAATNTGRLSAQPLKSTTYVLTARGGGHTYRQSVRVNVTPPPLPVPLNAHMSLNAVSTRLGQPLTLNAASVALQTFGQLGDHVGLIGFQRLDTVSQTLQSYVPLRQPPAVASGPARVLKAALSWLKGVKTTTGLQSAK
jgi:serine/threonine protein kinase